MRNQSAMIESSVPNGTAPEDPPPIRKKLSKFKVAKRIVGNSVAVQSMFCFQACPPREAYRRVETYPATPVDEWLR